MSEKFIIKGKSQLSGTVKISGYKNSAGAVLSAALLSEQSSTIDNLPRVVDVLDQIEILKEMGAEIKWLTPNKIKINPQRINPAKIPVNLFERMRVSVLLIGPLLSKFKQFKVPHPGGDKIGLRPISSHLGALKKFGVKVKESNSFYLFQSPKRIEGRKIVLEEFSVTATENLMMLAAIAKGKTKIEIAASEPQVQDLAKLLEKMGAKVTGAGTHAIEIEGRAKLKGASFSICPDPTEAGTFLIALAITGGKGRIKNVNPENLVFFLEKMREIGINFKVRKNEILVSKSKKFSPAKIQVLPFPGFPTDLQPQTSILLTQAQGKSLIHDPLFENRFHHLHELRKMGADIEITDPHRALVFGKSQLLGKKLNSSNIRAGAALVLAALIAKGKSQVENVYQIDRGYEKFDEKLRKLGAKIKRV